MRNLTDDQVFSYFAIDRTDTGAPKWAGGDDGFKSDRLYYLDHLRDQCGVWEPAERDRMWRERKARQKSPKVQA